MSFANPTQIRLGLTGKFLDRNGRVIGRAVLGMVEAGQTYYWNEFYLESSGGQLATLVFEETAGGGKWRLFSMVEPKDPMTAAAATATRKGDTIYLHHSAYLVTRVAQSRVYYVEGKTPQGVQVGNAADYFNAECGQNMVVVSWTGNEVEYYEGATIGRSAVASAFGLGGLAAWQFVLTGGRRWFNRRVLLPCAILVLLISLPAVIYSAARRPPAVTVLNAPLPPLPIGASARLNGVRFRIAGQTLLETEEVGLRFQQFEYTLQDEDNSEAMLIQDPRPNVKAWYLATPLHLPGALTPGQAGNIRQGQVLNIEGRAACVLELFRSTIRQTDNSSFPDAQSGDVLYGFVGSMRSSLLLVRWNEHHLTYHQLDLLPPQAVTEFTKNGSVK